MKWQVGYWDLKASVAGVYKPTLVFACIFVLLTVYSLFQKSFLWLFWDLTGCYDTVNIQISVSHWKHGNYDHWNYVPV